MGKTKSIIWGIEFLCIIAIGLIPLLVDQFIYLIPIPIVVILVLRAYECRAAVTEKHLRVKVQLSVLNRLLSWESQLNVRCTYHVPVWWPPWKKVLRQTCNYIPSGRGGGRTFPIDKGIIGKAFSEKTLLVENFGSDEEFRTKMVGEYGYSKDEIQEMNVNSRSYLCCPLVDEKTTVLGLIYFDSSQIDTFTENENDKHRKMIKDAAETIRDSVL